MLTNWRLFGKTAPFRLGLREIQGGNHVFKVPRIVSRNILLESRAFSVESLNNPQQSKPTEIKQPPAFIEKMAGVKDAARPPVPANQFILMSGLGGALGIGALSVLHYLITDCHDYTLMLGSFGATAVLIYGAPAAPFSQPRNVVGGHLISAFCGVTAYQVLTLGMGMPVLAAPVGVALAIMGMQKTNTVHPPAGGTALIAVLGSPTIHAMGYGLLLPSATGSMILVGSAVVYNNIFRGDMRYPQYWF